mgnify:FL=1
MKRIFNRIEELEIIKKNMGELVSSAKMELASIEAEGRELNEKK